MKWTFFPEEKKKQNVFHSYQSEQECHLDNAVWVLVSCPGFLFHQAALLVKRSLLLLDTLSVVHHRRCSPATMSMELQMGFIWNRQNASFNGNISVLRWNFFFCPCKSHPLKSVIHLKCFLQKHLDFLISPVPKCSTVNQEITVLGLHRFVQSSY